MTTRRPPVPRVSHRYLRRRAAVATAAVAASAGVLAWAGPGAAHGTTGPTTAQVAAAVPAGDVSVMTEMDTPPTTTTPTTTTSAPTTTTTPPTTTTPTTTTSAPTETTTPPLDRTPPVLTCSARPSSLGNANNHKLVPVSVELTASDAEGSVTVVLASVVSNQADRGLAEGDVPRDIVGWDVGSSAADTAGELRRERYGSARVYTLTYVATDASGNQSTCTTTVSVAKPG